MLQLRVQDNRKLRQPNPILGQCQWHPAHTVNDCHKSVIRCFITVGHCQQRGQQWATAEEHKAVSLPAAQQGGVLGFGAEEDDEGKKLGEGDGPEADSGPEEDRY